MFFGAQQNTHAAVWNSVCTCISTYTHMCRVTHCRVCVSFLPPEKQKQLLEVMCGVVSERTKRLCSRSINCPQHTEDQRKEIRTQLCRPLETSVSPVTKKKAAHHSVDDDISGEAVCA